VVITVSVGLVVVDILGRGTSDVNKELVMGNRTSF
jgi:hypothetical protein